MCRLCSEDGAEKDAERDILHCYADYLEKLASGLRALARGTIKPHSEASKKLSLLSRGIIRYLVAEWM